MYHNYFDAPLQLQWRTKKRLNNDDAHVAYTTVRSTTFNTSWAFYCCIDTIFLHIDGAPPAKRTSRRPLLASTPAMTMLTSNSQLRWQTSRPQVHTKWSKPPQRAYHLQKQNTRSAHSQLWSPHSPHSMMSMAIYSRSSKAPLINTMVIVKLPIINTEYDNPSK